MDRGRACVARLVGLCVVGTFATGADAAEFRIVPTNASGTHEILGNEIRLSGGGQRVWLDIQLADWSPDLLRSWQARIEEVSYTTGSAGTITPASEPCTNHGDCFAAFGASSLCFYPPSTGGFCNPGFIDNTREDWVHINENLGASKDVGLEVLGFLYFAVLAPGWTTVDPGSARYGGTLVLDVPIDAAGTFTISLREGLNWSFMGDENNVKLSPQTYVAAYITIICENQEDCEDNNDCTTDICNLNGTCSNEDNYEDTLFCCNPTGGALTTLSDGNPCTQDLCDQDNGSVSHPNEDEFAPCGDPGNSQCDKPDSCDGAGTCLLRYEPVTATCGSLTDTECDPADLCDGAGECITNIAAENTPCGVSSTTECDDPDTCNGLGACLTNTTPDNTPCDDGLFCTLDERCNAGVCADGNPRDCADLLTCTTDLCNDTTNQCDHTLDANRCLVGGVCYLEDALNTENTCEACESSTDPNGWTVLPDETLCNDGNACTGTGGGVGFDTCTGGVCSGELDPECNDLCSQAVEAVVGENFSDNSSTGPDDGEASCQPDSNNDVWFAYTALCDGAIFISTTGSALAPSNDTVLNVFDDCPAAGSEIAGACDDDSGVGLNAALTFATSSGTTYLIRVAGFEDNVGPIVLNLRPVNDCLIDGVCYAIYDFNPANHCQACIPDVSTTQWSNRLEGSSCGSADDDDCDSPDACDGAGFCEVNYKPDGTECSDEFPAEVCTKNLCASGLCTHPPEDAGLTCGSPNDDDCDNPDTCDGGGSCADNYEDAGYPCEDQTERQCDNPNICDDVGNCLENLKPDGTPCDDEDVCTGTDECTGGVCAGTSILEPPLVEAIAGRYIRVTPQPPGSPAPVALWVTSPDWPCLDQYINLSGQLVGEAESIYMLTDDWGTITVQDPDIVPSTQYDVQAVCGAFLSDPGSDSTPLWGDIDQDGDVDVIDVAFVVDMIKLIPVPFPREAGDLYPCPPDGHIGVLDVAVTVDAVKELPYPCAFPCHD